MLIREKKAALSKYFYLLLLIPLFFIGYPLITTPGIPIGNGDLPIIETTLYPFKKFWTWIEYGSYHAMETISRYPIMGLIQLINIVPELTSKLLIIAGFAIASLAFYFSFVRFFENRIDIHDVRFKTAAIFGSLFYAYNVWSFHRIGHWYLWIAYALLPIFFVSVISLFNNRLGWKSIVLPVLLWSVASSTPHMAFFFGVFFLFISLFFGVKHIRKNKNLLEVIKPTLFVLAVYMLVNSYWIYPYLGFYSQSTRSEFAWGQVVTEEITEALSRDSSFLNVLRLIEETFNMGTFNVSPDRTSFLYPFWVFASFIPPILAFSCLLWRKYNPTYAYTLIFSSIAAIGIFLTLGTNAPFHFYSALLFSIPLVSNLQILFREPDKWGMLIAFGYSFLIGMSGFVILSRLAQLKRYANIISIIFSLFIVACIALYFYPAYQGSLGSLYNPVIFPNAFGKLNEVLTNIQADKVFILPFSVHPTTWGGDKGTGWLYQFSSSLPNIAATNFNMAYQYPKYIMGATSNDQLNNISNLIYPLGTSHLIYHNDTLMPYNNELLNNLLSLGDVKNITSTGFFTVFQIGNERVGQLNIPRDSMLITGGLDQYASLNFVPGFESTDHALLFLDQRLNNQYDDTVTTNAHYSLLHPDANNYVLSMADEIHFVEPFEATNHHNPWNLWSKAAYNDPGNAWFNSYVENFGMHSWDFDYGKGLVHTWATGTNLSIPVEVAEDATYDIFVRNLKNQKGGMFRVYLDNQIIGEIRTDEHRSHVSTKFVWDRVGQATHLVKGKHIVTLENVAGFNAVNVFSILPAKDTTKLFQKAQSITNKTTNIFLLEAESFFENTGRNTNFTHINIFNDTSKEEHSNGAAKKINDKTARSFEGRMEIPEGTDLVSIGFLSKGDSSSFPDSAANNSHYIIRDLELFPAEVRKTIYDSNFDGEQYGPSLTTVRNLNWTKQGGESYLTIVMPEQNGKPITGNQSLKVEVEKANTTGWSVVSTDFIPVDENVSSYLYSLDMSAIDVHQLHSKVIYFNSTKEETGWDFVFGGRDGSFKDNITNLISVTPKTEFLKLQLWVKPDLAKASSYIIHDAKINPLLIPPWINYDANLADVSLESQENKTSTTGNQSLKVNVERANTTDWSVVSTDFIPVDENAHNVSLALSAKNVNQLHSRLVYFDANKQRTTGPYGDETQEIVFPGQDGSFSKKYSHIFTPPIGAKYVRLEVLASHHMSENVSTYWIDNVKIQKEVPQIPLFKNEFTKFKNQNDLDQPSKTIINESGFSSEDHYLKRILKQDSRSYDLVQSELLPATGTADSIYNYRVSVETQNISSLAAFATFRETDDTVDNPNKHGNNASSGNILTLSPGSEIHTYLDVLKPSNYSIAIRANICEKCTYLKLSIKDEDKNILTTANFSLKEEKNPGLTWLYLDKSLFLQDGKHEMIIHSDSHADLDSVMMYSIDGYSSFNSMKQFKAISSPFDSKKIPLATIDKYEKINPTKHEVIIKNATGPYILSFAESYDPSWVAYIKNDNNNNEINFSTNSIPLYSIVNGFYIKKTGDYTLIVEYQLQGFFVQGTILSLTAVVALLTLWLIDYRYGLIDLRRKFGRWILLSVPRGSRTSDI